MPKRTRTDGNVMDDDLAIAGRENGGDEGARSEKNKMMMKKKMMSRLLY